MPNSKNKLSPVAWLEDQIKNGYPHGFPMADLPKLLKQAKQKESDLKKQIRSAFADYYASEGCGCCSDRKAHKEAEERLSKLLSPKKYKDGSGSNWYAHKTQKK